MPIDIMLEKTEAESTKFVKNSKFKTIFELTAKFVQIDPFFFSSFHCDSRAILNIIPWSIQHTWHLMKYLFRNNFTKLMFHPRLSISHASEM